MDDRTFIIGLDVGYGDTKAACDNGRSVTFPSLVAPAESIRFTADVGSKSAAPLKGLVLYGTEEGDLFVGELAAKQGRPGAVRSPRDRDRVADAIVTHLTDAALAMLLPDDIDYAQVKIVTGLPVDYFGDADALVSHLQCTHTIKVGRDRQLIVDVLEVKVLPQPFGGLLSLLLDASGTMMPDVEHLVTGRIGVADPGMYTTDYILVDGLEYIESGSGSLEVGVSTVLEMLRKVLMDDYRVSYEPHELEIALRRGWLVINGQTIKLNGLASDRLSGVAHSIESRARTLWNISTLSTVVFVGGGAIAMKRWLEPCFGQSVFATDGAMSIANGFLRYGLRTWRR